MAELEALQRLIQQQALAQGESKGLEQQRANAMALRDAPAQQAGRRSGYSSPLGNIAQVLNSYSGNKMQAEVAPKIAAGQQAIAEGQAAQQNYALQKAVEQQQYDRGQDADAFGMKTEQEAYARGQDADALGVAAADKEHSRGLAKAKLTAEQKKLGDRTQAWNIESGEPVQTYINPVSGMLADSTGEVLDADTVTFTDPAIAKQKAAALAAKGGKGKKGIDPMSQLAKPDTVSRILTNPLLGRGTGFFDPERIAGSLGYGADTVGMAETGRGSKIQSLHGDMAGLGIDSVKKNLEGLGVNPTDKDLEIAFRDIPSSNTQPEAWVRWAENNYKPLLEKTYNKAFFDGDITREERDAAIANVDASIEEAKAMWAGDVEDPNVPIAAAPEPMSAAQKSRLEELRAKHKGG